ncbi:hypothetical protein GDO86_001608, partial [Hymenochirus boettgeri]
VGCNSQVVQPKELTFLQGNVAEISCTHTISTYERLFWYKARSDMAPEHIISGYKSADDMGPIKMTFNADKLSTSLIITNVQVSDSGLYHCAVRDAQ